MRSGAQITRTVEEWQEHQRRERQRALAELLAILARSRNEHWYRWLVNGRPQLSQEEYERERIMRPRARR